MSSADRQHLLHESLGPPPPSPQPTPAERGRPFHRPAEHCHAPPFISPPTCGITDGFSVVPPARISPHLPRSQHPPSGAVPSSVLRSTATHRRSFHPPPAGSLTASALCPPPVPPRPPSPQPTPAERGRPRRALGPRRRPNASGVWLGWGPSHESRGCRQPHRRERTLPPFGGRGGRAFSLFSSPKRIVNNRQL